MLPVTSLGSHWDPPHAVRALLLICNLALCVFTTRGHPTQSDDEMAWMREHQTDFLESLLTVMRSETVGDLRLQLADEEVSTSRLVLSAISPVFHRMLTSPMREGNNRRIVLDFVTKESWDIIMQFFFLGEARIAEDNVEEIVEFAHMYSMEGIESHCGRVMSDNVSMENCVSFLETASRYNLEDSTKKILRFMRKNFETVSSLAEFSKLSERNVKAVLEDSLLVQSEDSVFRAVISWLVQNEVDAHAGVQLLDLVSLEEVSAECLSALTMQHPQLFSCDTFKKCMATSGRYSASFLTRRLYERPSKCSSNIVVLGTNYEGTYLYGSDRHMNMWLQLSTAGLGNHFAACILQQKIYVTGGNRAMKSTVVFDLETKTWSAGPDLLRGRKDHAMTTIGQSLFAVGGINDWILLSSIEKMDVTSQVWTIVGNLKEATHLCGAAAVDSTIIVVGADTLMEKVLIQTFNTANGIASLLQPKIPGSVSTARGVSAADGAVLLSSDGELVRVKLFANGKYTLDLTDTSGLKWTYHCGLMVDIYTVVFGGCNFTDSIRSLFKFTLDGVRVQWGADNLPEPLQISGIFKTKVSFS